MITEQFIVYKNLPYSEILEDMFVVNTTMDEARNDRLIYTRNQQILKSTISQLIELGSNHGFYGNLWHDYLTLLLASNENVYSMPCEIRGTIQGSVNDAVLEDYKIFQILFAFDLKITLGFYDMLNLDLISNFQGNGIKSKIFNERISATICEAAKDIASLTTSEEIKERITSFYKQYGVGKFGLHKAFRIQKDAENHRANIVPILNVEHVYLDDLVGYEIPKKKLIDNTEAFVKGKRANNCLLFGDAGTGKSSCIKGILNQYYDEGLRIIEVYKHQFEMLHDVIAQIKDRNYKFIIYMDDLSFEEFEIEYKYLKAIIEGGLESRPKNLLIYATSNRRHLIKEQFADKDGRRDRLHASDTVQEKLSLVNRFGVTIFFCSPDKKEFQQIVTELAKRNDIDMDIDTLLLEANKWEISHGGLSGRTAQQFIDYLLGAK